MTTGCNLPKGTNSACADIAGPTALNAVLTDIAVDFSCEIISICNNTTDSSEIHAPEYILTDHNFVSYD